MIAAPRVTMTLQPLDEAEPDTRALVTFYLGDEQVASTLRKVDTWPACSYCDEDIEEGEEAEVLPDEGLHHATCTPRSRKRKAKA